MSEALKPTKARLWACLRENKHRELDLITLADFANVDAGAARHHLTGWCNAGIVGVVACETKTRTPKKMYRLVNDIGVDAPMVKMDGTPSAHGQILANMWRTMRMLKRFDKFDVQTHASTSALPVSDNTVKYYLRALTQAGYLTVVHGRTKNTTSVYFLQTDTGPRAPMVQDIGVVFDQNLNKIMWQEEAGNE